MILTPAQQREQGARCGCRGTDDMCPCQNVPDARTACVHELAAVCEIVSAVRCDLTHEKAAQADMEAALVNAFGAAAVSREHRLSARDVVDFLVFGRIALELKGPRHTQAATCRQLERYAVHSQLRGIVLATARAMRMPSSIGGWPCRVINLGQAWL